MGRKAKFPKPLFLSVTWGRATMSSKGLYLPPSTVTVTCVLRIGSFSVNGSFSLLPLRISVGCDMFCMESLKVIFKASFNKTLKLLFVLKIILELHFWKGMFSPWWNSRPFLSLALTTSIQKSQKSRREMSFISQGGEESLKFKSSDGATSSKANMSEGLKSCVGIMLLPSLCPSVWKSKEQVGEGCLLLSV